MKHRTFPKVTKEQLDKLQSLQPLLKDVKRFEREPAYQETNFDHVGKMLDLFVLAVEDFNLKDIDHDKVTALILSHDLGEIGMEFDIGAHVHANCAKTAKLKEEQETATIKKLAAEHGDFILDLIDEYNSQSTREGRLVKALDKLDALIQIFGIGIKHEPTEDKISFAMQNLLHTAKIFPELAPLVDQIRKQTNKDVKKRIKELKKEGLKTATHQPSKSQE